MQTSRLDPLPTIGPNGPDRKMPSALMAFSETARSLHQRWAEFGGNDETIPNTRPGFSGTMYEFREQFRHSELVSGQSRMANRDREQ
jgi:hypothetical protein